MNTFFEQCVADLAIPAILIKDCDGNNACPSYLVRGRTGIRVYIDHPDADMRDCPSARRFAIVALDDDTGNWDELDSFDQWSECLAYLIDHFVEA